MAKLTEKGGFNTAKTASNTWEVIKKILMACMPAEDKVDGDENGDGAGKLIPVLVYLYTTNYLCTHSCREIS